MKAIILAAGMGNRIKEITGGKPKCFLDVDGKPIIQHQIDILRNAGIDEIIIVVGYKKECFEDLKKQNIKLVNNPFYKTTNVLGSFWFAKDLLSEPFIFTHGDTYFEPEILNRLIRIPGNNLAVEFKTCGREEMKVKTRDGYIVEISKEIFDGDGEFIGVARIDDFSEIRSALENLIENNYNEFFERIISELIKSNVKFKAIDINNLIWEEIDFNTDYADLLKKIRERKNK